MSPNRNTQKAKILNAIRGIFKIPLFEKILLRFTLGKKVNSFYYRIAPLYYSYKKNTIRRVCRDEIFFELDISDMMDWFIFWGFVDPSKNKLYSMVKHGNIVIDIGSNIGEVLINLAKRAEDDGVVYGFEPDRFSFQKALKNISLNRYKNILLNNFGLSDSKQNYKLYTIDSTNRGMNRIYEDEILGSEEFSEIETRKLDDYIEENNISKVDLIKIDTEGFEMKVLDGAKKILMEHKPLLFIELSDPLLQLQKSSSLEVVNFLISLGYNISHSVTSIKIDADYSSLDSCDFDIIAACSEQLHEPICIICSNKNVRLSSVLPNYFNKKIFKYYQCPNCNSLSLFPLPNEEDRQLMYGINDYSYLSNEEKVIHTFDYRKHTHQKMQIDYFKRDITIFNGKKILDFACGNGFYMAYANTFGFETTGTEINAEFAALLKDRTGLNIICMQDLQKDFSKITFDIIHLGHCLEHLPDPRKIINELSAFSNENTIFVIDGPLENNICLSRFVINKLSLLKRAFTHKKQNEYPPQHITFTNYKSQKKFFEQLKFEFIKYEVSEQYWPLPERIDKLSSIPEYLLARISIFFSSIFKRQGNVFHFVGRLNLNK